MFTLHTLYGVIAALAFLAFVYTKKTGIQQPAYSGYSLAIIICLLGISLERCVARLDAVLRQLKEK